MNDEAAFVAAIAAAPDDQHLPLIFADWLDDHGDPRGPWLRSPFVRQWMPPTYENPVPKLLESLRKSVRVTEVRRAAEVIGEPIVPGLIELLAHENARVRHQACTCLRNIGKRATNAVPALLAVLSDSDRAVREQAAKALNDIGPGNATGTDQLKAALTDDNWNVRDAARKVLGKMGAKGSVLQELVEKFDSPDLTDRLDVIEGLHQLGTAGAIPTLDRALDDPEPEVREKAIEALGRHRRPEARRALRRALQDPLTGLRAKAAGLFDTYSMTVEDVDALVALLDDEIPSVRRAAVDRLSGVRDQFVPPLVPRIIDLLDDLAEEVQQGAIQALGSMARGRPAAMESLIAQLGDPRPVHRQCAIQSVGDAGYDDPAVLAALLPLLNDPSEPVAHAATYTIGNRRELPLSFASPLLARLQRAPADSGWGEAISTALKALGRINPTTPEILAALREAVRSPQENHQVAAIEALTELGPAAVSAVPDIATRLRSDDIWHNRVTWSAAHALLRLGGQGYDELARALDDGSDTDRRGIFHALACNSQSALPLLPALLGLFHRTEDDWQRKQIMDVISYIGPDAGAAIPDLVSVLENDGSVRAKTNVLEVFRGFGSVLVPHLPKLIELSRRPEFPELIEPFAWLFATFAPNELVVREPLRELLRAAAPGEPSEGNLQRNRASARSCCASALLRFKDVALLPDIVPLLADPEAHIRRYVIEQLGQFDTPAVLPLIRQAFDDVHETVRLCAIEVLTRRTGSSDETVAVLVEALEDREPKVRRAAVDALNKLKVGTPEVVAALSVAINDDDKKVAERAAIALKKVTPKEPAPAKAKKTPDPAKPKKAPTPTKGKKKPK